MNTVFFAMFALSSIINTFPFCAGSNYEDVDNSSLPVFKSHHREIVFLQRDTIAPVKIQLEKTSFKDMSILFISDTAEEMKDLGSILSKGYGELIKYAQENQLKLKKMMAWYYSVQAPWKMDIAIETDKLPVELSGRVRSRIEKGGEVLIAHMWGPYSELSQAYIQIQNWLNQNKRIARDPPFEVYLNDPSTVKDPSEIQTDIYQPLQ